MSESDHGILRPIIGERLWVAQNMASGLDMFRCFTTADQIQYRPWCDDFGPMSMSCVFKFVRMLDHELSAAPDTARIAYCVEPGCRALTNAVFLLGAYMIIRDDRPVHEIVSMFSPLNRKRLMEPFRDASYASPDFALSLKNCWLALARGRTIGWLLPSNVDEPEIWGDINEVSRVRDHIHSHFNFPLQDEYDHYDDALNGDMHIVVPGRFVAFRGPKDLKDGREYLDDSDGCREYAPSYYIDIFHSLQVKHVLRLNTRADYRSAVFTSAGIDHSDLYFRDCSAPPPAVTSAFFRLLEREPGVIAVHCRAGLGRTGTLIAMFLMKEHGFTAREAIAWMRIMRPGSIVGEQQHFLAKLEVSIRARIIQAIASKAAAEDTAAREADAKTKRWAEEDAGVDAGLGLTLVAKSMLS